MPKPPDRHSLVFDPPLASRSEKYQRAYELLREAGIHRDTVVVTRNLGDIAALGFPSKQDALIFKLRL